MSIFKHKVVDFLLYFWELCIRYILTLCLWYSFRCFHEVVICIFTFFMVCMCVCVHVLTHHMKDFCIIKCILLILLLEFVFSHWTVFLHSGYKRIYPCFYLMLYMVSLFKGLLRYNWHIKFASIWFNRFGYAYILLFIFFIKNDFLKQF